MGIEQVEIDAYRVPTEEPESDGTLDWDATTVVVVRVHAEGKTGLGFTYATSACVPLIADVLAPVVLGADPVTPTAAWAAMIDSIRNIGRPGVASMAIAAVDIALWDLKAKILDLPLCRLLGQVTDAVPVYGSGGFTSYTERQLTDQLSAWVHEDGMARVKMKIGSGWGSQEEPDIQRVRAVRRALGDAAELFVDANGAYSRKQAVRVSRALRDENVVWFEEPVSSDDLEGLAQIRNMADVDVAAGEYGYDLVYFRRMSQAGAVDVLQADISRCAGLTEWLRVAAVADAYGLDVSGHCAQSLHVHAAVTVRNVRHLEYFHDHARVDRMLFEGVLDPIGGMLRPDLSRPGLGLELKEADASSYRIASTQK